MQDPDLNLILFFWIGFLFRMIPVPMEAHERPVKKRRDHRLLKDDENSADIDTVV